MRLLHRLGHEPGITTRVSDVSGTPIHWCFVGLRLILWSKVQARFRGSTMSTENNKPSTSNVARRPKVVVVGAGFGGLEAAKALARAPVDVTVIDRRNFHLFQPLLCQVATAVLPPSEIAWPIRSVFA